MKCARTGAFRGAWGDWSPHKKHAGAWGDWSPHKKHVGAWGDWSPHTTQEASRIGPEGR